MKKILVRGGLWGFVIWIILFILILLMSDGLKQFIPHLNIIVEKLLLPIPLLFTEINIIGGHGGGEGYVFISALEYILFGIIIKYIVYKIRKVN